MTFFHLFLERNMLKKSLCLATLALGMHTSWAQDVHFGFISTESSQNIKSDWQPLIDDMEKQTGLKIKTFFASDYAGIIEGMLCSAKLTCKVLAHQYGEEEEQTQMQQ